MRFIPIILLAALLAVIVADRRAVAGQTENFPILAYASPAERSLVDLHAKVARTAYLTEEVLFSCPSTSIKSEEGIMLEWRDRVFRSISSNMTPEVANGERMVARIAVRETMKLVLEHYPE